tara:strand:+ start:37518 stop:37910 length:393 start_codon:yes stop_codon:yes gene_type:complete
MKNQFSLERRVQWLDGRKGSWRPGETFEHHLHLSTRQWTSKGHTYKPHLYGTLQSSLNGYRVHIWVWAHFFAVRHGGYKAEIVVETSGIRGVMPHRRLEGHVFFTSEENAPKKLNKVLREMRETLLSDAT